MKISDILSQSSMRSLIPSHLYSTTVSGFQQKRSLNSVRMRHTVRIVQVKFNNNLSHNFWQSFESTIVCGVPGMQYVQVRGKGKRHRLMAMNWHTDVNIAFSTKEYLRAKFPYFVVVLLLLLLLLWFCGGGRVVLYITITIINNAWLS